MPHLEKLYRERKEKGLIVLAVNYGDPDTLIRSYYTKQGFTFPVLKDTPGKGSLASLYGVSGYPTTYLLDETGKALWHSEGGGITVIRKAVKQAELR